jgi:hypothetical protein
MSFGQETSLQSFAPSFFEFLRRISTAFYVARKRATLSSPLLSFGKNTLHQSLATANESHGGVLPARNCSLLGNNSASTRNFSSLPMTWRDDGVSHLMESLPFQ